MGGRWGNKVKKGWAQVVPQGIHTKSMLHDHVI
jgi:hypothetical protein